MTTSIISLRWKLLRLKTCRHLSHRQARHQKDRNRLLWPFAGFQKYGNDAYMCSLRDKRANHPSNRFCSTADQRPDATRYGFRILITPFHHHITLINRNKQPVCTTFPALLQCIDDYIVNQFVWCPQVPGAAVKQYQNQVDYRVSLRKAMDKTYPVLFTKKYRVMLSENFWSKK